MTHRIHTRLMFCNAKWLPVRNGPPGWEALVKYVLAAADRQKHLALQGAWHAGRFCHT